MKGGGAPKGETKANSSAVRAPSPPKAPSAGKVSRPAVSTSKAPGRVPAARMQGAAMRVAAPRPKGHAAGKALKGNLKGRSPGLRVASPAKAAKAVPARVDRSLPKLPPAAKQSLLKRMAARLPKLRLDRAKAYTAMQVTDGLVGLTVLGSLFTPNPLQSRDEILRDFAAAQIQERNEQRIESARRLGKLDGAPKIVRIK